MFDLSDRVALVTGAGQNAGEAIARSLAAQGARVLVNDLRVERAETVASAIVSAGGAATPVVFDVTDLEAVRSALAGHTQVDVLVCNAGNGGAEQMVPTPFHDMAPDEWAGPIGVNLDGVLHCVHAVLPGMRERRWGRIVVISSGAGTEGVGIGVAPYSAGKGGAISFIRSIALENASRGVTANSVALGLMSNVGDAEVVEMLASSVPAKRLGEPADVAALCSYLTSPEASWITGQTIGLNGGSATS